MKIAGLPNTLADSLEVVLPHLSPALVPSEIFPALRQLASALAPIVYCGFEVRLGDSPQVDLQQRILAGDGEPQRLRAHLAALHSSPAFSIPVDETDQHPGWNHPDWQCLDDFLARWIEPSSPLRREITELWLELDHPSAHPAGPPDLPPLSVFAAFQQAPGTSDRYAVAQAVLNMLPGESVWAPWQANVQRCFESCPPQAFVSHIGVMLGRKAPALRINIKKLPPGEIVSYLQNVGWAGERDKTAEVITHLYEAGIIDHSTVCLDVGTRIYPHLGLECGLRKQPPEEPRWAAFLDTLVRWGWCRPEKRDALLQWPGNVTPADTCVPWPGHLLHAGLLQPPDSLSILARELGHIKIVCRAGQIPEAKAYFGFLHHWHSPGFAIPDNTAGVDETGQYQKQRRATTRHSDAEELDEEELKAAIGDAVDFLLKARHRTEWWHDFARATGGSDEWVTAYVGAAMAAAPDQRAYHAAQDAWSLLQYRRWPAGGWGYNRNTPVDADSTTWGLHLAAAVGAETSERARGAHRVLQGHLLPEGGLSCYHEEALPRPLVLADGRSCNGSFDGWCRTIHPCTTAAAARLGEERPRSFLRRTQRDDGSWTTYWWKDEEYTTALAAEALAQTGQPEDQARVRAAIQWAVERTARFGGASAVASGDESAFAAAWRVRILALVKNGEKDGKEENSEVRESLKRTLDWLLGHQRLDGSWNPSARMRIPAPNVTTCVEEEDPEPCPVYVDEAGIFTAATVLSALSVVHSRLAAMQSSESSAKRHVQ